tara:strand:- start:707 stop:826 length:120 start_codon:yes stop_codon:yes gene_type:complete
MGINKILKTIGAFVAIALILGLGACVIMSLLSILLIAFA